MTAEPLNTLNSCPFCGGYAALDSIKRYDIGPYGGGGIYYQYRIICRDCGMVTHTVDEGKRDALIAAWNRRVSRPSMCGSVHPDA
jgi:Lar family restriction alleviation protein